MLDRAEDPFRARVYSLKAASTSLNITTNEPHFPTT